MARRIDTQERGRSRSKFESSLISGVLKERTSKASKNSGMPPLVTPSVQKGSSPRSKHAPASPYTDSKGAAAYLGISKAKFFRVRRQGHFKPSPITGRYYMADLDLEARGIQSTPTGRATGDAELPKTFGKSESVLSMAPLNGTANPQGL